MPKLDNEIELETEADYECTLEIERGWSLAIKQAEKGITQAKERIEKLERSIEVFKECRERGDPWPGSGVSPASS